MLELDGNGDQTANNVYGGNTLISREVDGETLYYLYNGHGDVVQLTDDSGAVVMEYKYDAFGNVTTSTGSKVTPYRYRGYQFDDETGLFYVTSRYYNPVIARFTSADTYYGQSSDPLSLNLYTYCHNEPVMNWDPTGHVVTAWDVAHSSSSQVATIQAATNAWNAASARGDTAGMAAAHAAAEAGRNSAGYSSNSSGYVSSSNGSAAVGGTTNIYLNNTGLRWKIDSGF